MFHEIETHEYDPYKENWHADYISVGRDRDGEYLLVFDGPNRLETVIRFDEISIGRNNIVFYRQTDRGCMETGHLEGTPESHGEVGAFLEAFNEQ